MGWVSAIGREIARVADAPPVAAIKPDLEIAAAGAAVGAALPAETAEERARNVLALGGGMAAARRLAPGRPDGTQPGGFAGTQAKTADLRQLEKAQAMEGAGIEPRQIWQETGWLKGDEGAWKFEINDEAARFRLDEPPKVAWEFDLEEVFDHPELFAAYPELRSAQVVFKDLGPLARDSEGNIVQGSQGAYDNFFRTILINNRLTREEAREAILHEGQHGIQDIEGFAKGGMPEPGREVYAGEEIEAAFVRLGDLKLRHDAAPDDASRAQIAGEMETLKGQIREQSQIEAYLRLPGEVEARLVERRKDMTAGERRAAFPPDQRDVEPALQADPEMRRAADVSGNPEIARAVDDPETDVLELDAGMEVLQLDEFIAFHGTRARFDTFETSRIGSGEGAQAYGPGHYFTQSAVIAEWYRKRMKSLAPGLKLGKDSFNKADPTHFAMQEYWKFRDPVKHKDIFGGYRREGDYGSDHEGAIAGAIRALEFERDHLWLPAFGKGFENPTARSPAIRDIEEVSAYLDAAIDHLKSLDPESSKGIPKLSKRALPSGGSVYTVAVKLPEDATIQFDQPLSAQPARVQQAFREAAEAGQLGEAGKLIGRYGDETKMGPLVEALKSSDTPAMETMRKHGVRGVRYLDGFSRGKKDKAGQTFNYVAFNDEDVRILGRQGFMFSEKGSALDAPPDPAANLTRTERTEWQQATAKGLDMSEPARVQRAEAQGYTIEAFRGIRVAPKAGELTDEQILGGAWFAETPETANSYAADVLMSRNKGFVMKARLKMENPLVIDAGGAMFDRIAAGKLKGIFPDGILEGRKHLTTQEVASLARAMGHDGVEFQNIRADRDSTALTTKPGKIWVSFNPENVRSANAAFDPMSEGQAGLMLSQKGGPLVDQAKQQGYKGADTGESAEWIAATQKGLSMATASRMQRAREMGFDTDTTVYHGTPVGEFSEFDTYGGKYGLFGLGTYTTESADIASSYARPRRGMDQSRVFPLKIRKGRVMDMDEVADMQQALRWRSAMKDADIDGEEIGYAIGNLIDDGKIPEMLDEMTNEHWFRVAEEILTAREMYDYEGAEVMANIINNMNVDTLTHLGGGRVRDASERHRVWIVLDPSNIRSVHAAFDPMSEGQAGLMLSQKGGPLVDQAKQQGYKGADTGESAEWIAATQKGLPMDTPARMQRAREMGFDTDTVLYHGTNTEFKIPRSAEGLGKDFEAFDPGKFGTTDLGWYGAGFYFSPDPKVAGGYTGSMGLGLGGHYMMPVLIRGNLMRIGENPFPDWLKGARASEYGARLKEHGYDGIVVEHTSQPPEYVIFDPSNIRSVHAAFDPDNSASSQLLAGFGDDLLTAGMAGTAIASGFIARDQMLSETREDDAPDNEPAPFVDPNAPQNAVRRIMRDPEEGGELDMSRVNDPSYFGVEDFDDLPADDPLREEWFRRAMIERGMRDRAARAYYEANPDG